MNHTKKRIRTRGIVAISALGAIVGVAAMHAIAAPSGPRPHASVELLSSASSIVAGEPFTVALRFEIDPKWHLYWKNPGDSGMPPSVKWTLPEGFTAGELRFPAPQVLKTSAGVNYIYEENVVLLVTITPPKSLADDAKFELSGEVKWLECDVEICLPAKQSVVTRVLASDKIEPYEPEKFAAWEEAVRAGESFDPAKQD